MQCIVSKFGGSSLATGLRFLNAAGIVRADRRRKLIVVSAPGRRFAGDEKMTDMLLRFARTHDEKDFSPIRTRFTDIGRAVDQDISKTLEIVKTGILRFKDENYTVSRGEYLSARIMARILDFDFIDAASCIRFRDDGILNEAATRSALTACFDPERGAVLPGFYGAFADGRICIFPRGGSDITGAWAAAAVNAVLYENWTDVNGVYDKDPAQGDARLFSSLTYGEMRRLCALGATVLHVDCLSPVEKSGIPIWVKNSFCPNAGGTVIS